MSEFTSKNREAAVAAVKERRATHFATNQIIQYEGLDKDDYLLDKDYLIIQKVIAASPIKNDVLFKRWPGQDIEDGIYSGGHITYAKSDQCLMLFEPDEWTFDFGAEVNNAEWSSLVKAILFALDDEQLSWSWSSMFFLDDDD